MDGVFQGSSWLPIIHSIDSADRALHTSPSLVATLAIVAVYYFFMGSWPDLLMNACVYGLKRRPLVAAFTRRLCNQLYATVLPSAVAIGVAFLILYSLNRKAAKWTGFGRPYLLPCKTTHTRLFPQKHSFSYSYVVVGIPVGVSGNFNGMISVSNERRQGFKYFLSKMLCGAWYDVHASDYLQRGFSKTGLRGKLDTYLRSQAIDPDDYPHAYLVTAARFLGYHFNPLSLWYLYSPDRILSAIVLEVNNTFDERRPYLVLRDFSTDAERLLDSTPGAVPAPRIKGRWAKDFHVSPFNSRKGTYSLLASDPLHPGMGEFRGLDVTINLSSSKGHAKIIARLFSDGKAIDPECMSATDKIRFLSRWFWVGFATFPRIVKEAAMLFFKRKLHVWYRPEPLKESLGRHATATERVLETAFRSYLRFLVVQCRKPLVVRYMSSGITGSVDEVLASPSCTDNNKACQTLQLKVLTPRFYTRFVHYAHDFEAIFTELTDSGTIWTDQPHLLPDLCLKKASPPLHAASAVDYVYFKGIQHLRRRPSPIPRVSTSADPPATARTVVEDIRDFRISSMDAYILQHADSKLRILYRSTVLRLLAADNYFLGSLDLLSIALFVFRSGLAWLSVTMVCHAIDTWRLIN
ncbi:hypothetical protein E4U55_006250 [Claviceps digitariae]|nr:hypothetical protein E4U55_006250 [Claviceps digitariae]